MTHAIASWLWRIGLTAARPGPERPQTEQPPIKIAVERLPDYLWRELGFSQPRPSDQVNDWPA